MNNNNNNSGVVKTSISAGGDGGYIKVIDPNKQIDDFVNQEDLTLFVDLVAKTKNRSLIVNSDNPEEDGVETTNTTSFSFIAPRKNNGDPKDFVTTDWTELSASYFQGETTNNEGFGITNINIEIKASGVPTVTIDFVDIRGKTLFEQGSCSPYAVFFYMPYPIFELTVKGYYGEPVKWYLNLTKFDTKFNTETGNFESKASFIGWSYAFLADMVSGYAMAAPYMTDFNGENKLKSIYSNIQNYYKSMFLRYGDDKGEAKYDKFLSDTSTEFQKTSSDNGSTIFCEKNSNGVDECLTIIKLIKKISKLEEELGTIGGKAKELAELKELTEIEAQLNNYRRDILEYGTLLSETGKFDIDKNILKANPQIPEKDIKSDENVKRINNLFFQSQTGRIISRVQFLKQNTKDLNLSTSSTFFTDDGDGKNVYNKLKENNSFQRGTLDSLGFTDDNNSSEIYVNLNILLDEIKAVRGVVKDKIKEKKNYVSTQINQLVKNNLGFTPTIRNIFIVLTANVELFNMLLLDVTKEAEKTHKEEDINDPNQFRGSTNKKGKVFPWPTYITNKGGDDSKGDSVSTYPGDDFPNWPEVRFVESFINGYMRMIKDLEAISQPREGRIGYDNYLPISPLETPLNDRNVSLNYANPGDDTLSQIDNISKTFGERVFVLFDHTFWNPINLTEDNVNIPTYKSAVNGYNDLWTPLANENVGSLVEYLGRAEAHNLLNSIEDANILRNIQSTISDGTSGSTIWADNLYKTLNKYGSVTNTDFDGVALNKSGLKNGTKLVKYKPNSGSIILSDTANSIQIKPNPHDMRVEDLFKIEPQGTSKINIVDDRLNEIFLGEKGIVNGLTNSTVFKDSTTSRIKNSEIGKVGYDTEQLTPLYDNGRSFISLNTRKTNLTDLESTDFMNVVYTYEEKDFSDYIGQSVTFVTNAVIAGSNNFNFQTYDSTDYNNGFNITYLEDGQLNNPTNGATVNTLVQLPIWLDNVNSVRTRFGANELETEKQNLAYLFLNSQLPTPLISQNRGGNGNPFTKALLNFNNVGSIVNIPKTWLLAFGSILWRYRSFVGTKSDGNWYKISEGEINPNSIDPLSQPGYPILTEIKDPIYDSDDRVTKNLQDYLSQNIFTTNTQSSDFSDNVTVSSFPQTILNKNVKFADKTSGAYFRYYEFYSGTTSDDIIKNDTYWPIKWQAPWNWGFYMEPREEVKSWWLPNDVTISDYMEFLDYTDTREDYTTFLPKTHYPRNTKNPKTVENTGALGLIIERVPDKVKDVIIEYFLKWSNGGEWEDLLKTMDPNNFGVEFSDGYEFTLINDIDNKAIEDIEIEGVVIRDALVNDGRSTQLGNYLVTPNESLSKKIYNLTNQKVKVINSTPKIWWANKYEEFNDEFIVKKDIIDQYIGKFTEEFNANVKDRLSKLDDSNLENESVKRDSIFGDTDVMLSFYNNFKSLSDKWITSSTTSGGDYNFYYNVSDKQCTPNTNSNFDFSNLPLASHFSFVDRVMNDIGGTNVIDVKSLRMLQDNPKMTFYQLISELLGKNNYNFFPMASYTNFSNVGIFPHGVDEEGMDRALSNMFRPVTSWKCVKGGPHFIAQHIAGFSKTLDYKYTTNCGIDSDNLQTLNDSFTFTTDGDDVDFSNLPEDFSNGGGVTAFRVQYGNENQNHFKSVHLDQSDFSDTQESLELLDNLTKNGGDPSKKVLKSQSLYNVYLTRSYNAGVETMGNAMIQPLMYFQLDNIPMFHGTYLITEVSHSIQAHNMNTSFKGTRQPIAKIPVVTDIVSVMDIDFGDAEGSGDGIPLVDLVNQSGVKTVDGTNTQSVFIDPTVKNELNLGYPYKNTDAKVTSQPGTRKPPKKGASSSHKGADVALPVGSEILSMSDGVIKRIKLSKGGFGLHIMLQHNKTVNGKKYWSLYAHLSDINKQILDLDTVNVEQLKLGINVNKEVTKGFVLGLSGGVRGKTLGGLDFAGTSTGPHLHIELKELSSNGGIGEYYSNNSVVLDPINSVKSDEIPLYANEQDIEDGGGNDVT